MYFAKDLLRENHIVISGGAGALGLAIVRGFTEHGARVSVNDVVNSEEALARLEEAGVDLTHVQYIQADLTQSSEVARFLEASRSGFGLINTALCHAGIVVSAPLTDFPEDEWVRTMDINLKSAFLLGKAAASGAGLK